MKYKYPALRKFINTKLVPAMIIYGLGSLSYGYSEYRCHMAKRNK